VSIDQTDVKAKQGGKGRDVLIILVVSTVLAVLLVWGIMALWAADNPNVNDTAVSPGEAATTDSVAEDTVDVTPQAQEGAPAETNPDDQPVLQSDEPNPAAPPEGLP
jgi:flagellar basal body-associated protein FliL